MISTSDILTTEPSAPKSSPELKRIVDEANRRIPPLWPLKDFVAVNPFLGLSSLPFLDAADLLRKNAHGDILMPDYYYLGKIESGEINDADVAETMEWARQTFPSPWNQFLPAHNTASLSQELTENQNTTSTVTMLTLADFLDEVQKIKWTAFITEEISKWCSVYHDEGQSSWRMPWRGQPFFTAWKEAARHDANPDLSGLKTLSKVLKALPDCPLESIGHSLSELGIPLPLQIDFLHRQLLSVSGWSSYVQYKVRQNTATGTKDHGLTELLAVRLAYDLALWEQYQEQTEWKQHWHKRLEQLEKRSSDISLLPRYLLQLALERNYQRKLAASLSSQAKVVEPLPNRPALQAVFCIDVRSEIYRRHLEAQNSAIQTSGFAGFFGMPIEYFPLGQDQGSSQCPVLLSPQYRVEESVKGGTSESLQDILRKQHLQKQLGYSWNSFKTSAVSCFNFVETSGILFGVLLGRDSLGLSGKTTANRSGKFRTVPVIKPSCTHYGNSTKREIGIPMADQFVLAENALRNLGLVSDFPRLVLFCGHGSATKNNPYASGLDCGVCGGHAGHINARVAASLLNEVQVREELAKRGIQIPSDTYFIAGQHITTTDDVELYDLESVPPSHQEDLQCTHEWLKEASRLTRCERSHRLGLKSDEKNLEKKIRQRSCDWSQVRPEWGLASNAALIAAPRIRTKGLNLNGRTFLHDYEFTRDEESKVLELILVAPVIVASWINLQYFASTVNNRLFGSGNKTIHNVVGTFGIWQGNGGDLQTGLPLQSLHDGKSWVHEPLRLNVFIEAPAQKIEAILDKHLQVRELIENQWFHLFRIDSGENTISQFRKQNLWVPL